MAASPRPPRWMIGHTVLGAGVLGETALPWFWVLALLRSVSVNLAELRRAPASGGAPTAGGLWENIDQ